MNLRQRLQVFQDRVNPYIKLRWGFFAILIAGFAYRILRLGAFYLVAYCVGIFYLN